jgi:sugar diacid utilization regulator
MGMEPGGAVTVGELLALLEEWHPRLLAGRRGLGRRVSWAGAMRARLPAFEDFTGGELALLSLGTLRVLRSQVESLTLSGLVEELAGLGAAAIAIADPDEGHAARPGEARALEEAIQRAEQHGIPLLELPGSTPLAHIERTVIRYVVARRELPAHSAPVPTATAEEMHATLRSETLQALLTGTYANEALMASRAAQLGFDLALPHAVLDVELAATGPYGEDGRSPDRDGDARTLASTLELSLGAWVRVRGANVMALLPVPSAGGIPDLLERVRVLLKRTFADGVPAWAGGLGEPAQAPSGVHRSAEEAHTAEQLGVQVLGPGHIARPADLGIYRLLLALRRTGELAPFVERTLAPLKHDRRMGEVLVETLEVFFACNGNVSQAKERLHLHRNSMHYRLHRIRELLGHDLEDPDLRLALQLAIKGQRVLALS